MNNAEGDAAYERIKHRAEAGDAEAIEWMREKGGTWKAMQDTRRARPDTDSDRSTGLKDIKNGLAMLWEGEQEFVRGHDWNWAKRP